MNINMNIKQMADEDNLECVFYFLINDARKDRGIKDEAGKRICQHFMSVVDVSRYGICSGAITRDSASLRGRVNALLPVRAEFILIEPEKDLICLLTPEQIGSWKDSKPTTETQLSLRWLSSQKMS